ncbi:VCBS domain-containing protein, partial [Bradyrhizobium sp. KB893862 SZCCT0404]|uniref:VCBS domain-containing protein n=1 Tax=Bradyrhizobium sp. KB893862 SZCCT0404 TaxID=2807672 RepID=UPI001BADEAC7
MATQTTGGGTTVSFGNTPQAVDDTFNFLATNVGILSIGVLANDLGGNAKVLWSVDNATSANANTSPTANYAPADLLKQDTTYATAAQGDAQSTDTSKLGAKIWINANGTIGYDSTSLAAQLQALGANDTLTDTFTYAIRLGNGTLSWATATVIFAGVNDAATIAGASTGAVIEAGGVNNGNAGSPNASGTLAVQDVDNGQAVFQTVATASLAGTYGNFTFNSNTGAWTYVLDNTKSATQGLIANQVVHDTLTVKSADGTASQVIDVTVTGSNDNATITGTATGAVTEAGGVNNGNAGSPNASGTLAVQDVDNGQAVFQTVATASLAGTYGNFTFNSNTGAWTYVLDNTKSATQGLIANQVVHDTLTVKSADGTASQVIDVTVTGSNDNATITGTATGAVTEAGGVNNGNAGSPNASGTLAV